MFESSFPLCIQRLFEAWWCIVLACVSWLWLPEGDFPNINKATVAHQEFFLFLCIASPLCHHVLVVVSQCGRTPSTAHQCHELLVSGNRYNFAWVIVNVQATNPTPYLTLAQGCDTHG